MHDRVISKVRLDWTGLDWTGLDWTGLDWTGLDWLRLGCGTILKAAPAQTISGWLICYLDATQTAYLTSACSSLVSNVVGLTSYGCWHYSKPFDSWAASEACRPGIQQSTSFSDYGLGDYYFVVCLSGPTVDGAPAHVWAHNGTQALTCAP